MEIPRVTEWNIHETPWFAGIAHEIRARRLYCSDFWDGNFPKLKSESPLFVFFPLFAKNASKQPSSVVEKYKFLPFHDQRVEDEKKKKRGWERKVEEAFRRLNSTQRRWKHRTRYKHAYRWDTRAFSSSERSIELESRTNERASVFYFFFFLRSSDNLRINFNRLIYNLVSSFIRAFRSRERLVNLVFPSNGIRK